MVKDEHFGKARTTSEQQKSATHKHRRRTLTPQLCAPAAEALRRSVICVAAGGPTNQSSTWKQGETPLMSRILAQVLVAGATVLVRAGTQAWAQALANAQRSGVAQEAASAATRSAMRTVGGLSADEARLILQVEPRATWEQVSKRFEHLMEKNEKHGSFYLQSKVYRARERLQQEYEALGVKTASSSGPTHGKATAGSLPQQ